MSGTGQFVGVNRIRAGITSALLVTILHSTSVLGQTSAATEHTIEVFDVGLVQLEAGGDGITELMTAVDEGDLQSVEWLIWTGAYVNALDRYSQTALIRAADLGHVAIVRRLLESGAITDIVSAYSETALSQAVHNGHESIAELLLQSGASPSLSASTSGYAVPRRLLEYAASKNQLTVVKALIAAGADIETEGPAALTSAILNRNADMIDTLLSTSVDVNGYVQGRIILHTAARAGDLPTLQRLLDRGANVDSQHPRNGSTPLIIAAAGGRMGMVNTLLAHNATVTARELKAAMWKGQNEITLTLIDRISTQTLSQPTLNELLMVAENSSDDRVIESLLTLKSVDVTEAETASLVLARSTADDCTVSQWRPKTNTEQLIYQSDGPCRGGFSIDDQAPTFYAVTDNTLQVIDLEDSTNRQTIRLPVDLMDSNGAALLDKWRNSYGEHVSSDYITGVPYVVAAGNLPNGDLGLLAYVSAPVDGHYAFLYVRTDHTWRLAEEEMCGKFSNYCELSRLSGRPLWVPPDDRAVWHPNIRLNPYFVGKDILPEPEDMHPDYPFTRAVLHFNIDNHVLNLHYRHSESGHCGDHCDTIGDLKFQIGDTEPVELAPDKRPIGNSIIGRYILLSDDYRYGSFDLFDIGTGKPVFKNLYAAAWAF